MGRLWLLLGGIQGPPPAVCVFVYVCVCVCVCLLMCVSLYACARANRGTERAVGARMLIGGGHVQSHKSRQSPPDAQISSRRANIFRAQLLGM